jgi:hypothetical protein
VTKIRSSDGLDQLSPPEKEKKRKRKEKKKKEKKKTLGESQYGMDEVLVSLDLNWMDEEAADLWS